MNQRGASTGTQSLLTLDQAAEVLNISGRQLRGHVKAGNISFIDVGLAERPSYRFRPSDLTLFQTSRAMSCAPTPEVSSDVKAKRTGSTTSSSEVIDFAAQQLARKSGKPKSGS